MAFLPIEKNLNVEDVLANASSGKGVVHIPDGKYRAIIVESEMKPTKGGEGQMLELKFVITQGEHQDVELYDRLNIVNKNATTVKIAYETLAKISKALGFDTLPEDSNLLHNKPIMIELKTEAGKPWVDNEGVQREGKDKSVIKGYDKVPSVVGAQSVKPAAVGGQKMPWHQK